MPRFTNTSHDDVLPQNKRDQPSLRQQTQQQYQDRLRSAVVERHQALVVELEPEDKPLTIRNRLKRAGERLGIANLVICQRGRQVIAYQGTAAEARDADQSAITAQGEGS
jgi:hypothetical protein